MWRPPFLILCLVILFAAPAAAEAPLADAVHGFDGAHLPVWWAVPFSGLLLSIALLPLVAPSLWHHHYGKVALGWAVLIILPSLAHLGLAGTVQELVHVGVLEYLPFILLLLALFTVAGGLRLDGFFDGTPRSNLTALTVGTGLASITGTTGAAMLLIRPLIRANAWRSRRVHTMVFFIFLVANIGGSLTPLGDPPLFLGFLKGVPFFWPTVHLLAPMLVAGAVLLAAYFLVDLRLAAGDGPAPARPPKLLEGSVNFIFLGAIMGAVLVSGIWQGPVVLSLPGAEVTAQALMRDGTLVLITILSLLLTPRSARAANEFTWGPILEVAKLFAAIFVTIVPVLAMLKAGLDGPFAPIVQAVADRNGAPVPSAYFWATGILSSFLDNAPTYLVFFNLAGGDPIVLTTTLVSTLAAISAGAVFMGANTYIGNAPNFMVRAIAEEMGIRMPSFFGYLVWSCGILLPVFVLLTLIFF
ncbi:MAG TPA: sodium:proton antiporter [Geminicoccus sp.]|jgi:Na+/H+ antiporter NhaD/arsenite permease-like protein|uniref:sodium:proton antiporter n=1 Tax=Geminicoccus sp. TaxID=2024832 RepID=UPI002E3726D3|nr:sodium:proton antiporter [Geminicoccus sp.]HEX2524682.1 sodium:proton antiporter [Geminicoccus sp.]